MPFGAAMNESWEDQRLSRRDFLKLARTALLTASGLIGLAGFLRYLGYETEPPAQTDFDLGPASNFAPGSRTVLPQVPAMLVQTEKGFTALSLVCPHLGCTVESQPDGFACPCHGSRFDLQGQLVRGPAAKPLTPLRVETTADGHLHLYTG
jgi:cytochrome b6-f complex iron-sulfur subunit